MKTKEQIRADLVSELDDLNGKIERLEKYLRSVKPNQAELLYKQLKAMSDYKLILVDRIINIF